MPIDLKALIAKSKANHSLSDILNRKGNGAANTAKEVEDVTVASPKPVDSTGGFLAAFAKKSPEPAGELTDVKPPIESVAERSTAMVTVPPPELASSPSTSALAAEFHNPGQPEVFSEKEAHAFRESVDLLIANIENKEIVGQCIRHIMQTLQTNPQFKSILQPKDLGLMVRAIRVSYGTAIAI